MLKSLTRIFPGWFVVLAAFLITCVGFGCAYSFSAFVDPLETAFGASRGSVSLVFSLAGFAYFALGAISGPLGDRIGARRVAVAGMLILTAGLLAASWARSLDQVCAAYGLGVGFGVGLSYVPAIAAVQRWFARRRALASGLAVSGIGVGTLVLPPLATFLVAHIAWRDAYRVLAAIALAGALGAMLLRQRPEEFGLYPDGDVPVTSSTKRQPHPGVTIRVALGSRIFATLYASCLLCGIGVFVPFVHLMPYAEDHGITAAAASILIALIGLGSTLGRFALGGFADRIGRRGALIAMLLGLAGSMALWLLATQFWSLAVFAFLFGTFYGGWVAVLPAVVMDAFGGANVGGIIGLLYTSVAIGTLVGPAAAGFLYDRTGGYGLAIVAACAADLLAATLAALTPRAAASNLVRSV